MKDSIKHKGLRKRLIDELANRDLYDSKVLKAMLKVPRHLFIESNAFLEYAYKDQAFPIAADQTISHPSTVACQTTLLNISPGEKILEVGTGSGYQTAVLIEMKAKVYTIERQRQLYDKTKALLPNLGYRPKMYFGDGYKGIEAFAPYDKIIVTCGAPFIPDELVSQLRVGGLMIIPIGDEYQEMIEVIKVSEKEIKQEIHGEFKFVPMLKDKNV